MRVLAGAVMLAVIGALLSAMIYTMFIVFFELNPRFAVCFTGSIQGILLFMWGYMAKDKASK